MTRLAPAQITAIIRSIKLGKQLQKDMPEIADDYRNGMFAPEIVQKRGIVSKYRVSKNIAKNATGYMIRGHNGGFNINPYDGLITDSDELKRLHLEHRTKFGLEVYDQGLGIHGRTAEERKEYSRKGGIVGGIVGGDVTYKKGLGIHGRTSEQHREDGRKAGRIGGRRSAIARGQTPWKEREITDTCCFLSEIEIAYGQSQLPECKIQTKGNRGKVNFALIAQRLNDSYHKGKPVRKSYSVGTALYKFRRKRGI